jgi:hypothetical protein
MNFIKFIKELLCLGSKSENDLSTPLSSDNNQQSSIDSSNNSDDGKIVITINIPTGINNGNNPDDGYYSFNHTSDDGNPYATRSFGDVPTPDPSIGPDYANRLRTSSFSDDDGSNLDNFYR